MTRDHTYFKPGDTAFLANINFEPVPIRVKVVKRHPSSRRVLVEFIESETRMFANFRDFELFRNYYNAENAIQEQFSSSAPNITKNNSGYIPTYNSSRTMSSEAENVTPETDGVQLESVDNVLMSEIALDELVLDVCDTMEVYT